MPEMVRIGELSKAVHLHINTLRRLADQAEIPVTTTSGGHRLFEVAAVLSALEMRSLAKRPSYLPGAQTIQATEPPTWQNEYPLNNLNEDLVFQELKKDLGLDMSCGAADILPYAFTEMLNNAIDHSEGAVAKIRFWRNSQFWAFEIVDDGVGVFRKISDYFNLESPIESIGELTKGKRTTTAQGHTGEGIFFTSKVVDRFELTANGLEWDVDNSLSDFTVIYRQMDRGTRVYCRIAINTRRRLEDTFRQFSINHEFVRTRPTVKLFEYGTTFVSRSEAKRILAGLEEFQEIELDFQKVESVGQGFVDEVFRVWISHHPGKKIIPINMNSSVEFMVRRGIR
jgi:anti-sigma regulatory factor (Ser/Thr protein kinase)